MFSDFKNYEVINNNHYYLQCRSDSFIKASEGSPVKVVKPVLQKDNAITVAVIDGDYRRADKDGKIDLNKTLDVIIEAQKIFDKAVKDVK